MAAIRLIQHAPGAPGLRWFGLGPGLRPTRGLLKLQRLFNKHAFWARGRSIAQLRRLLAGSTVVITLWRDKRMIGFGR
ncbi:MAG: N-acetyltransferase, partial [Cyanobacteriota bacterium]|nr:N-acetyltransferase [Cyanobacteriota bacterium]